MQTHDNKYGYRSDRSILCGSPNAVDLAQNGIRANSIYITNVGKYLTN